MVFIIRMRAISYSAWTFEQKWTLLLLFTTILSLNPLFPLVLVWDSIIPSLIDVLGLATHNVALFLFWLSFFDGLRYKAAQRNFRSFWFPKLVLLFIAWLVFVIFFTLQRYQFEVNPSVQTVAGYRFWGPLQIITSLLYVLWLGYTVLRAFIEVKSLQHLQSRLRFMFVFSGLNILVLFGSMWGGLYYSTSTATMIWAINCLYVWALSYMFAPGKPQQNHGGAPTGGGGVTPVHLSGTSQTEELDPA